MNTQKSRSSADKMVNLIITIIILVVLAAGLFTVVPLLQDKALEKSIADGTAPQTVATYAKQAGLSVDEYIEMYELSDADVNGNTLMQDFVNLMDVKNYAKLSGMEYADFVAQYSLTDKVTEDMLWTDAQLLMPLSAYIGGADYVEDFKSYYGLDASVTADTPWGELADVIAEKDAQMQAEAQAAADETEAPAEEGTEAETPAEGEADATEAPAAE